MFECKDCGARAPMGKSLIHNAHCFNGTLTPEEVRWERRTVAMERQAEAIQHAATALADFAMALNTFGPALKMMAAELEADLKKRAKVQS